MNETALGTTLTLDILTAALERAAEGIVIVSVDDTSAVAGGTTASTVFANPAAALLLHTLTADLLHRHPEWFTRFTEDNAAVARVRNAIRQEQPWTGEVVLQRADGSEEAVEAAIRPLRDAEGKVTHWVVQVRDLADRKRLEQQLWQAQKVTAIANLAGGVAHEFNNTLLAISGYTDLLLNGMPEGDPRREDALAVEAAATRAARLIHQLLAFSLPRPLAPRHVDLNEIVNELQPLLERVIGENIQLRAELEPHLGTVFADFGQLQQVLVNLVVNARDAMPLGGTLTITTSNTYPESMLPGSWVARGAGAQVLLTISDTGIGMSPEVKTRLFEPFFTTKDPNLAPGLGLSTVHAIVKQCGGYVWVQSAEGEGTSVRVYLPYAGPPVPVAEIREEPIPIRGGTETILLVEDEPAVRALATRVLERYGYAVHPVENATEALNLAATLESNLHLLVTDVVLPGQGGPALSEALRAMHPDLKILFISGYAADHLTPEGLRPGQAILAKPFTPNALAAKVRETLETES